MAEGFGPSPTEELRSDSSLANIALRFTGLLWSSSDFAVDLNQATEHMVVQKRRIYDVVNILEGAGLVEKVGRSQVQCSTQFHKKSEEDEHHVTSLKEKMTSLEQEERELDEQIAAMKNSFTRTAHDPDLDKYAYVRLSDVEELSDMEDQTAVVVKASPGTKMEIPTPSQEQIMMWLQTSEGAPIETHWIRPNEQSKVTQITMATPSQPGLGDTITTDTQTPDSSRPVHPQGTQETESASATLNNQERQILQDEFLPVANQDTCKSLEQLITDLMHLHNNLSGKNNYNPVPHPENLAKQSPTSSSVFIPDDLIPNHIWETLPVPLQPNTAVPVSMDSTSLGLACDWTPELSGSLSSDQEMQPFMPDELYRILMRDNDI